MLPEPSRWPAANSLAVLLSLCRLLVQEAPSESFVETRTDLPIRKDAIQGKILEGEGMPWAL